MRYYTPKKEHLVDEKILRDTARIVGESSAAAKALKCAETLRKLGGDPLFFIDPKTKAVLVSDSSNLEEGVYRNRHDIIRVVDKMFESIRDDFEGEDWVKEFDFD